MFASSAAAGRVPETRPLHRTLSAAMSAPGSEPAGERLEIRLVLGLEGVDEDQVERPLERRVRADRIECRRVDDRDPLVGDPRLAPPAAREVGPLAVGIDGDDRAVGRLAEGHPQRRVAIGRADLDDPPPVAGQDPAGRARRRDRRSGCRVGSAAASIAARAGWQRRRERLDPVEVDGVGDPASIVLAHRRPHTSNPAPK